MKRSLLAVIVLILAAPLVQAQIYRWVDETGKVHYGDQPPPAGKNVQRKNLGASVVEGDVPYAVRQAMRNFPVVLYSAPCGAPCGNAKQLLTRRGISFTEQDATDPTVQETLRKFTGGELSVPLLLVGKTPVVGFEESRWHSALDAAGYPRTAPPARPASARKEAAPTQDPKVAERFPVTFYTAACGPPCDRAKAFLTQRGIPFTEKNAADPAEQEALRQLAGSEITLPLLLVGNMMLRGFEPTQWGNALDTAGYPRGKP